MVEQGTKGWPHPSFLALLILWFAPSAFAQTFVKTIGSPTRDERGVVLLRSISGDLYVGGSVADSAMVVKVDDDGNVIWSRSFKPPGQTAKFVVHLTEAPDGMLVGCGNGSNAGGSLVEGFHFKLDPSGAVLWVRHWEDANVVERQVVALDAGEYLVYANVNETISATSSDLLPMRIDGASGEATWISPRLDLFATQPFMDEVQAVATIDNAHYAASLIHVLGPALDGVRAGVSKFTFDGQHIWTRYLLFPPTASRLIRPTNIVALNDSLTVSYTGDINGVSNVRSMGLIRLDTLGNVVWARDLNLGGSAQDLSSEIITTSYGYIVSGRASVSGTSKLFLMAVSFTGVVLWTRTYGDALQEQLQMIDNAPNVVDVGAGYLMTGHVVQPGGDSDILLIRTDQAGGVSCSPVTPRNTLTTLLPLDRFDTQTQEIDFSAGLSSVQTEVVDATIADLCSLGSSLGNDTTSCATVTLDPGAIPGATYEWQDGTTAQTLDATASGTYWVRVSVDCCVATDTIEVEIAALTALDLGNDTLVCGADGLLLEAPSGSADLLWSNGSTDPELLVVETGEYWLTVTSGSCSVSDTIEVEVVALPTAVIEGELLSCDGSAIELEAVLTGEGDLVWDDGSTATSRTVGASGEVWVQVTDQCGMVADTVDVAVVESVVIDLGNDTLICAGQSLQLQADAPGWEFLWSDGSVANAINITDDGIYWLEVSNTGCAVRDSITVSILAPPTATLGADTTVCGGATLLLQPTFSDAEELSWSTGSVAEEITIATSGSYTVTATNACGSASDGIDVLFVPALDVGIGPDTLLCVGDTLRLDVAGAGFDVLWMDTFTGTTFTITEAGAYWVEGTRDGCLERDTVEVDYTRLALLDLGPDTVVCDAPFLELDAGEEGLDALWQNGTRDRYHTVLRTGWYTASITNYCGTITDSIRVSFGIAPVPLDTVDLCPGRTVELDPGGEMLFTSWSTGDTARTIVVGEGEYRYEAFDIHGCPHTDSTVVRITAGRDGLVYVPNSFTPNTDGYNDVWGVVGAEEREFSLALFDRWGQEIWRSNDPVVGWDGTVAGKPVPPGAYVYLITYRDRCDSSETEVTDKGHVFLVR